jgi:hypothetical protein
VAVALEQSVQMLQAVKQALVAQGPLASLVALLSLMPAAAVVIEHLMALQALVAPAAVVLAARQGLRTSAVAVVAVVQGQMAAQAVPASSSFAIEYNALLHPQPTPSTITTTHKNAGWFHTHRRIHFHTRRNPSGRILWTIYRTIL